MLAETGNRCDAAARVPGLCLADAEGGTPDYQEASVAMPRAQIKDEKTYQKLREKGESKEKSARIATRWLAAPAARLALRVARALPTTIGPRQT